MIPQRPTCGCSGLSAVEIPGQRAVESLASRPDLIPIVAVAVAGVVGVGLVAAWILSGEALGIETGSVVSRRSSR